MEIRGTNISMIRGDSETITISLQDDKKNHVPFVEGDLIYFTVKETVYTASKVLQKVITEFQDGRAIIEISPKDTKNIKFKEYVYDIQLNSADGAVTTIIKPSKFKIDGEVTYE